MDLESCSTVPRSSGDVHSFIYVLILNLLFRIKLNIRLESSQQCFLRPGWPRPASPTPYEGRRVGCSSSLPSLGFSLARGVCRVQGCFLQELSDPESQLAKHFRSKKEELAQRLYSFYNRSVFEGKVGNLGLQVQLPLAGGPCCKSLVVCRFPQLPERMEIIWNKKMQKTAGCCVSGQEKGPETQRYAKIMLSEKVCDSAGRPSCLSDCGRAVVTDSMDAKAESLP